MKIIQNIKFQYKIKLIEDLLQNSKYSEVNLTLSSITKKNPTDSYNLLKNFIQKILNITSEEKILNDNLVFINSFEQSDTEIITKFIDFYLNKVNFSNYEISDYNKELVFTINKIKNETQDCSSISSCGEGGEFEFINALHSDYLSVECNGKYGTCAC